MTKKDYIRIANVIRLASTINDAQGYRAAIADIRILMAESLAQENPKFDRERFLAACGVAK
jgi:hypothetical protein